MPPTKRKPAEPRMWRVVGGFICELVARRQMLTNDLHHSVG